MDGTILDTIGALILGAGNAVLVNHASNPGGVADGAITITGGAALALLIGNATTPTGSITEPAP